VTRRLEAHGIAVDMLDRWEARLYLRRGYEEPAEAAAAGVRDRLAAALAPHPHAYGWPGERRHPVLHLANFPLPSGRGDFGTGAVEIMREHHVFAALVEYDAEEAHRPLFAAVGRPALHERDFAANALQRTLRGQLGAQRFFTERDRPFCIYVVLGSRRHARALVADVNAALDRVRIDSR
jgi:hypothetical protein